MDGFGRTVAVETRKGASYDSSTLESRVDTEYGPCGGCAAMGKVKRVSMPYKTCPAAWTVYEYDFAGRKTRETAPDGVSRTTWSYSGNTTTITDQAGKWKKYTYDAFGQLVKVTEPDPQHGNVDTNYTFDFSGAADDGNDTAGRGDADAHVHLRRIQPADADGDESGERDGAVQL
jgi:YD repeat-containing protein